MLNLPNNSTWPVVRDRVAKASKSNKFWHPQNIWTGRGIPKSFLGLPMYPHQKSIFENVWDIVLILTMTVRTADASILRFNFVHRVSQLPVFPKGYMRFRLRRASNQGFLGMLAVNCKCGQELVYLHWMPKSLVILVDLKHLLDPCFGTGGSPTGMEFMKLVVWGITFLFSQVWSSQRFQSPHTSSWRFPFDGSGGSSLIFLLAMISLITFKLRFQRTNNDTQ